MPVEPRSPSMRIEALQLLSQFPEAQVAQLLQNSGTEAFGAKIAAGLDESLADERLLHGRWVQDLFRAVVISLDSITMIKDEDCGEFHCDPDEPLRPPDYRVVTKSGEQLLVEVKNVGPCGTFKPQKIRTEIVAELQAYALATGARLMFAHFWSQLSKWTLVGPEQLTRRGRYFEITVKQAVCGSELALLGERLIITRPGATLRLMAAGPEDEPIADPDLANWPYFTPREAQFLIDGAPVDDPQEYELVKAVTLFGGAILGSGEVVVDEQEMPVEMVLRTVQPGGHPTSSTLSQIYTNRYVAATKDVVGGAVLRMREKPDPTLTRLLDAAASSDRPGRRMQVMMIGVQQPTRPPA